MAMLIEELLGSSEGGSAEFKRDASSPRGIAKDFVAFSNSAHGWIVIGVDGDRTVLGLDDAQRVEETISNAIYASIDPQFRPQVYITTHDDKELVVIKAPYYQAPEPLALKEGDESVVYERVGSNSMPVADPRRLEQMRRERQGQSGYDQLAIPGSNIEDLNVDEIKREFEDAGKPLEDDTKLESYDLAATLNDQRVPTRTGLLLFGQNAFRRHVPDSYFRAIRYPGTNRAGDAIDTAEWRDVPLLEAVDGVLEFIRRNTGTAEHLEGRRRRQIPHYDEVVLRELLHNAVAHADYSEEGMHLNVSIYSDRLEIDSPGRWMAGMSAEQLRSGVSKASNRAIANTMHDLNYIERRGSAWAKALGAEEHGYPLPEWTEPGPMVRVIVKPHPAAESHSGEVEPKRTRADRRPAILEALYPDRELSAEELAEAVSLRKRRVQDYLRELQAEALVEPTKEARHPQQSYRLTANGRAAQVRNKSAQ